VTPVTRVTAGAHKAFRRWAAHGVSGTAAILLWLMMDGKVTPADIEAVYQ
jgi:hypothetical protein